MQEIMSGVARQTNAVTLYGPDAFQGMHRAGRLAAECLDALYAVVKPGVTTQAIDDFIFNFGLKHGAVPATLNYRGYRKSSCTSINHVVRHGIPNEKPLREGDIVNIDVTFRSTAGTAIPAVCTRPAR
jgi:methionyl aminopeptidase